MTSKWSISTPHDGVLPREALIVEEVLYDYDGPQIFSGTFGPLHCLFVKIKEANDASYVLAAELTDGVLKHLKAGNVSVHGAMDRSDYWILKLAGDARQTPYWRLNRSELSERLFPKPGLGLFHWHGKVPDSISQAEGLLSLKYKGAKLKDTGMPLGRLKTLVDQSYSSMRNLLAPLALANSRSSTFDIEVAPLKFASLVISAKAPVFNAAVIKRTRPDADLDRIRDEFFGRADTIAKKLREFEAVRSTSAFNSQYASENFSFLSVLLELLPTDDGFLSTTEINARGLDGFSIITFDKNQAAAIRKAVDTTTKREITEVGTVGGYIEKSQTVRFRSPRGKEVTCHFRLRDYEKLTTDPEFRKGARIKLTGRLTVRSRVDLMEVKGFELLQVV